MTVRLGTLVAVVLLAATAGVVPAAPIRQRVVIAAPLTIGSAAVILAIERGYFERFGIIPVVERSSGGTEILPTLNVGTLDITASGLRPATFEFVARGGRIRAVAAYTLTASTCTGSALVASRRFAASHPRTTIGDLRGALIGMNSPRQGSAGDFLMFQWLKGGGLTFNDVDLLRVPLNAMPEALIRGSLDAAQMAEPYLTQTLERGEGVILARDNLTASGLPTSLILIGPTLRGRPGLAARVLAAYLLGVRDYMAPDAKRNPETMRSLSKWLSQSEETLRKSCWTPIPRDGRINTRWVQIMHDWMLESGYLSRAVPLDRLIDEQYLHEAWRLLDAMGERIR